MQQRELPLHDFLGQFAILFSPGEGGEGAGYLTLKTEPLPLVAGDVVLLFRRGVSGDLRESYDGGS